MLFLYLAKYTSEFKVRKLIPFFSTYTLYFTPSISITMNVRMNRLNISILPIYFSMQRNRPPPLTEPERNAQKPLPTVTNSRTTQNIHRRRNHCSISFWTCQRQAAYGGGCIFGEKQFASGSESRACLKNGTNLYYFNKIVMEAK